VSGLEGLWAALETLLVMFGIAVAIPVVLLMLIMRKI
jgi:uncharacterized membrane protein YgaE (UPF0421/DUF939 family)